MSRFRSLVWLTRLLPRQRLSTRLVSFNRNLISVHCVPPRLYSTKVRKTFPAETEPEVIIQFPQIENESAYSHLVGTPEYDELLYVPDPQLLEGQGEIHPVVKEFLRLSKEETRLPLSSDRYEPIIAEIRKCVSSLNDANLLFIIYTIRSFPQSPGPKAGYYHALWELLDEECLLRAQRQWTYKELFIVDDVWRPLNLVRKLKCTFYTTKKCFRKCDKLTKEHFLRFLFILNRVRTVHKAISTYEVEFNLIRWIDKLTPAEVAVACMSLFKTETSIRSEDLVKSIVKIAVNNADTLSSINIAAISKALRLGRIFGTQDSLLDLQKAYTSQLHRLSKQAMLHLALVGTRANVADYEYMTKMMEIVTKEIPDLRLKELERLTFVMGMFSIPCPGFREQVLSELKRPERQAEIQLYGRCLPAVLHYLSYQEIFPADLISTVLDPEFIKKYYAGTVVYADIAQHQRELLCLDLTTEIEMPGYTGNRLPDKQRQSLLKHIAFYVDDEDKGKRKKYQVDLHEFRASVDLAFNSQNKTLMGSILPQFHTIEVLLCTDDQGNAVDVPDYIKNCEYQDPKWIPKPAQSGPILFHVFMLFSSSQLIHGTKDVTGNTKLRQRQLTKTGYTVHEINIYDFLQLPEWQRGDLLKLAVLQRCREIRQQRKDKLPEKKIVIY